MLFQEGRLKKEVNFLSPDPVRGLPDAGGCFLLVAALLEEEVTPEPDPPSITRLSLLKSKAKW